MKTEVDQVINQLMEASQSLSAGQLEQACARLRAASDLLDSHLSECAQGETSGAAVSRLEETPQLAKAVLAMAG